MNDVMSLGIHRIWKNKFVDWMNPSRNSSLIDVASGTGDIAKLFSLRNKNFSTITCVEPNDDMFKKGKSNLIKFKNIKWIKSKAEILPIADNMYDFYSISYGIRNVSDINKTLKEAYRVLKPGGRFMCLEFSKIDNELLNFLYKNYSKAIVAYQNAIMLKPDYASAYYNLGIVYQKSNNFDIALESYRKAARLAHGGVQKWLKDGGYYW